ncbi:MAG: glycosyltransferase [Flavobacteriales bacterium]
MTKALYISYDGMTDPLGQSQVLPYLKGLSEKGIEFHLISFEKEERFHKFKDHIQKICDEAGIHWYPLSYTKKPPLFSTIYDVQRMKRLARKLQHQHYFSVVHCRSYIAALVGAGMKKRFGTKFLFDMRGFWADERIDGNIWSLSNPVYRTVYNYFKKKEIQFFKEADHVVSLTYNGKNEIESWNDFADQKPLIEVIPCCVDLELFDPSKVTADQKVGLKERLSIEEGEFILGYVGSIGTWYMLLEMLHYFKVLHSSHPHSRFLFVTGEAPSVIRVAAEALEIPQDAISITSCLHKEVPLHISIFDASIFFIRPTFSKKASSPTKQGEIMAMGIPLICNAGVGDTDLVVEKYEAGTVLRTLTEDSFKENTEFRFNKVQTMRGAREFYSLEEGVKRYWGIYEKLLKG